MKEQESTLPPSLPDGPVADSDDGYTVKASEVDSYDEESDCLEPCAECMSRRVRCLDALTEEYECQNCGAKWFVESPNDEKEEGEERA